MERRMERRCHLNSLHLLARQGSCTCTSVVPFYAMTDSELQKFGFTFPDTDDEWRKIYRFAETRINPPPSCESLLSLSCAMLISVSCLHEDPVVERIKVKESEQNLLHEAEEFQRNTRLECNF